MGLDYGYARTMIRLRHRNWYQRTVLLAMAALLWSQFMLAGHGCMDLPSAPGAFIAAASDRQHDNSDGCDAKPSLASKALCDAHCTEGELSADNGRIPSIPPLIAGTWLSFFAVARVADATPGVTPTWVDTPPRAAWHRPTAHPAALLLI